MDEKNEIEYRVSEVMKIFLVSFAIAMDAIQVLLNLFAIGVIINRVLGIFIWLIFMTWFLLLGGTFFKTKSFSILLGSSLIEMIPVLDLIPGWTVSTLYIIKVMREEDSGESMFGIAGKGALKMGALGARSGIMKFKAERKRGQKLGARVRRIGASKGKRTGASIGREITGGSAAGAAVGGAVGKVIGYGTGAGYAATKVTARTVKNLVPIAKDIVRTGSGPAAKGFLTAGAIATLNKRPQKKSEEETYPDEQGRISEPAEFEELPKNENTQQRPNQIDEEDDSLNNQEFSMGDPYREPTK